MAVYDLKNNDITDLAKNETLFNACLSKNPSLTWSDFRRNLDTAYRALIELKKKHSHKQNTAKEIKPEKTDHEPCTTCGSTTFLRTGTCFVCDRCGSSAGCS
jgi:hypothetical protein